MANTSGQAENDSDLDRKRRKIEPTDEETNIINIIEDCQVEIFRYLDFESTVDVGISSPCLREAAKIAIKRKYGSSNNKTVKLWSYSCPCSAENNDISIGSFNRCLQFLRCFGDDISKLQINYDVFSKKEHKHIDRIDQYINLYCNDHLIDLEMCSFSMARIRLKRAVLVKFERPFKNVNYLYIRNCDLGNYISKIPELFPALRR